MGEHGQAARRLLRLAAMVGFVRPGRGLRRGAANRRAGDPEGGRAGDGCGGLPPARCRRRRQAHRRPARAIARPHRARVPRVGAGDHRRQPFEATLQGRSRPASAHPWRRRAADRDRCSRAGTAAAACCAAAAAAGASWPSASAGHPARRTAAAESRRRAAGRIARRGRSGRTERRGGGASRSRAARAGVCRRCAAAPRRASAVAGAGPGAGRLRRLFGRHPQ